MIALRGFHMSPRGACGFIIVAVASAAAACTVSNGGRDQCQTDSDCNGPRVCRAEMCVAPAQASVWPGFVEIGGALGSECTAALAADPTSAIGALSFIPCT